MIMLFSVIVPALFAAAIAILKPQNKVLRYILLLSGQAGGLALVLAALFSADAPLTLLRLPGDLSFTIAADRMGFLFALVGSAVFLLAEIFMIRYMDKEENPNRFAACFLFAAGAFYGLCFAGNLLTFYLFFEATTLLTFPLVLHEQTAEAILGAKKYLFYSIGGAFLALGGIVIILSSTDRSAGFSAAVSGQNGILPVVGAFLAILGFSAKAGMFPLQAWLPAAHPVCPAPASALLSGLIVKAGVLGIIRTAYYTVDPASLRGTPFQIALFILACITVVCGSTMAFFEPVLKRRLAYSTVSNLSYILIGLFLFSPAGLEGALFHVLAHAAAKTALFLLAGEIIFRTGKTEVRDLKGMGRKMPLTFVLFLAAGLSLVGIPPFGGFLSKWQLCSSAIADAPGPFRYILPGCLLLSALLTAGYLFMPVITGFYEQPDKDLTVEKGSAFFSVPAAILCVAGLCIGIFGVPLGQLLQTILA